MRGSTWTAVAVAVLLATGCGSGGSGGTGGTGGDATAPGGAAGTVLRPATLEAGEPLPAPAGKPLLRMTGRVSAPNRDGAVLLDRAGLARLRQVQVRVYEPWVKQDLDFRGVWLADLLTAAGVPGDATGLHITALDDYQVDLRVADVRAGGVLLATEAGDGSAIPIDQGGPTRIVFLGGVPAGANADQWIWSIKAIEVR